MSELENEKEVMQTEETVEETSQVAEEQGKELSEVEQLQLEIEGLKLEVSSKNDQLLRKVAEFENMRKRVERERYMTIQLSKAEALNDFLPVSDDLQRTLASAVNLQVDENFLKGVQLVAEKFDLVLTKNGIQKINESGVPFDVNLHEALMKQPSPSADIPSGTVLQVFESGYKMGDRVIRHAKVIVSE